MSAREYTRIYKPDFGRLWWPFRREVISLQRPGVVRWTVSKFENETAVCFEYKTVFFFCAAVQQNKRCQKREAYCTGGKRLTTTVWWSDWLFVFSPGSLCQAQVWPRVNTLIAQTNHAPSTLSLTENPTAGSEMRRTSMHTRVQRCSPGISGSRCVLSSSRAPHLNRPCSSKEVEKCWQISCRLPCDQDQIWSSTGVRGRGWWGFGGNATDESRARKL